LASLIRSIWVSFYTRSYPQRGAVYAGTLTPTQLIALIELFVFFLFLKMHLQADNAQ